MRSKPFVCVCVASALGARNGLDARIVVVAPRKKARLARLRAKALGRSARLGRAVTWSFYSAAPVGVLPGVLVEVLA